MTKPLSTRVASSVIRPEEADDVVRSPVSRLWPTEATVANGRDATGEISENWKFEYDRERRGRAAVSAHGCREDDQSRDSKSKANEQTTDAQLWQSPLPKPSVRPLVIGRGCSQLWYRDSHFHGLGTRSA